MWHIAFTLHFHDLTLISGDGGDGGGVTGQKSAKPATAVRDCI